MATQSLGEANQQLWDEALTRLLNLSASTVKRNLELEARVADLEVELSVWKQAHSVALDASERDNKAHNVQIGNLNRQIASMENMKLSNQNPLILCVIDGDGNIFTQSLLLQGQQGGRQAAQRLTQGIAEYLSNEDVPITGRLSFWVTIYYDKIGLMDNLIGNNVCTAEQFEGFLLGFSQASPRFSMVDVGHGNEAADAKIRECLQTYARFPQTLRIFFGGALDSRYTATKTYLETEQLLGKIVILQGHSHMPNELKQSPASSSPPSLRIDGLFMTHKPPYTQSRPGALTICMAPGSMMTNNVGLLSPQSPCRDGRRLIDPSMPLHKQNPPPCNEHYLMSCSKGNTCKYSHDYVLTPEQLVSLASNAKKAPCNWLKNGLQCPFGEQCCWGHVCPNGSKCFHLSKGKCWFKGESMHPGSRLQEIA